MTLKTEQIREILKTLPIGYYLGRDVPVVLDDKGETSYYNGETDTITISTRMIKNAFSATEEVNEDTITKLIRGLLYHELSHVILTPVAICSDYFATHEHREDRFDSTVFNIFEDERIETVLANYYMDTNFKETLLTICGLPKEATSPEQDFFNIVRYRYSKNNKLVNEVEKIINRYNSLTAESDTFGYLGSVKNLWVAVLKKWGLPADTPFNKGNTSGELQAMMGQIGFSSNKNKDNRESKAIAMSNSGKGELSGEKAQAIANALKELCDKSPNKEEINRDIFHNAPPATILRELKETKFMLNKEFYENLDRVIQCFNKKNSGGGSVKAYSGVINPRLVGRKDWRIFERANITATENQFGSMHLNLFIDKSGSFCYNDHTMRGIINALNRLESRYENFSYDLVVINTEIHHVKDKLHYLFRSEGGNRIKKEVWDIYKRLQFANTLNYNLILFDGDCFSDDFNHVDRENILCFNHNNCTIISDDDNECYFSSKITSAKLIFTSDYTRELIRNINETLNRAFR